MRKIFRGNLKDALKIPVVKRAFDVLREVRRTLHNLEPCRGTLPREGGAEGAQVREERRRLPPALPVPVEEGPEVEQVRDQVLLQDEVATIERIMDVAVGRKGVFTSDPDLERVVMDESRSEEPVVICYKDRKGRRTRRMIEPLDMETDPYTGMKKIEAYCYLRNDRRTFFAGRIVNAIPADTELSIISPDSL